MTKQKKTAIIIGAGPGGLTAAYELTQHSTIQPLIFEASEHIGGISRTVDFKGNKLDIGGHRFFSKSDSINAWWENMLPSEDKEKVNPEQIDDVMLIKQRLSRILFLSKLFIYPIQLRMETFTNLGLFRTFKIAASYIKTRLSGKNKIKTLEDLFIHRFGKELYQTFFKSYTEKVWGVSCREIKPEWGSQRIKNLSVAKTILHALKENFLTLSSTLQKSMETSLISQFRYPKYGPGQLWELTAKRIEEAGGEIKLGQKVVALQPLKDSTFTVTVENQQTGERKQIQGNYVISTMPIQELIQALDTDVPDDVQKVANGLIYRDFIIIGLLSKELKKLMPDQWVYIQEPHIRMGRLQLFNNWSPYLTRDKGNIWIGAEYFCTEGDIMWELADHELIAMAVDELAQMEFLDKFNIIDAIVVRQPKAYPAYFGTYDHFPVIREYLDSFANLFLIGRNGTHRYNNMDHSMMSAMLAVENIVNGIESKDNIWEINAQDELHEDKRRN